MTIEPFIHRCVLQTGDLAGNKISIPVNSADIEYAVPCPNCDNVLATTDEVVAHIYAQLTGL